MDSNNTGFSQTTVAVTTSAANALAVNSNRRYLLLQNNGSGTVYLNFTTTATTANGVKLVSGATYEPFLVPVNAISVIGDASATLICVEG